MKNRLLKTFTSLVLTVLMVISVMPAFAITIGAAGNTYELVKDASTLAVDDQVIIVAAGYDYAMSTTQNSNNRGQAAVTKNNDETITIGADVQVFTLKQGTVDGTFAFYIENKGYLYAASSSKNYLRTQKTLDANGSWKIEITLEGVATIKASGTNSRNWLRYNLNTNNNNGNPLFSCYSNGQEDVSIYKLVDANCTHSNTEKIAGVPATCTESGTAEGVACAECGKVLSGCGEIPATGHKYDENGNCTACGAVATTLTIPDALVHATTEFDKFYVTGTITSITNTTFGNMYIEDAEGNSILVYGLYSADGSVRYDAMQTKPVVGDTIKVLSVIGSYKDVNQLKDAWLIEHAVAAPTVKSVSLFLNKGVTVKVKINIPANWNYVGRANVVFSNGMSFEAIKGEQLVYSVYLTPAQINDALTVKITDAEGKTLVAEKDVSVRAYMDKAEEAGASKQLIDLLDAALTYSSVADGTYKGDDFTNEFNGVADHTYSGELFTSFAGQLGTYASIYINVTANVPDGETLVLKVGTGENERVIINGDNIANYITKNGQIVISGLYPANFNDTIYMATSNKGSIAEFSFNSYLKAIYKDDSSDQSVKNLAVATYLYGLAAEAYIKAQ